jgi:putative thioredoxin
MTDNIGNILDTSTESFDQEVIARSKELPVVVDFWAPWCQPCLMLAPVLEKLAKEYSGRVLLIKANVDEISEVAARYGVRSIPAVIGFRDGHPYDSFVGVLPEHAIREFFDRMLPTPGALLEKAAKTLEATDPALAVAKYREAVSLAGPLEASARIGLARTLLSLGKLTESQAVIDELDGRGYLETEAESIKAQLLLRKVSGEVGPLDQAQATALAEPDNLLAKFHWAEALAAAGNYAEALEIALDLVERDRKTVGEDSRKFMIALFNLLPPDSELTSEYRRRLSLAL